MISAQELIKRFHSVSQDFDMDLINIETKVMIAAKDNVRECSYDILSAKYSMAMNALKELGYKVRMENNFNKSIVTLIISW